MTKDSAGKSGHQRIRRECELLTKGVTICNNASTSMKRHAQKYDGGSANLEPFAAQLSSLLAEMEKLLALVDEEWVCTKMARSTLHESRSGQERLCSGEGAHHARCSSAGQTQIFEDISVGEDSQQAITSTPRDCVLVRNVSAGARSIQHIGPWLPARLHQQSFQTGP